eukprot:SAG25_NODE_8090_length_440_cov_1.853372_1_plen_85_part_00
MDAETQLALEKGQKNVDLDTGEVLQDYAVDDMVAKAGTAAASQGMAATASAQAQLMAGGLATNAQCVGRRRPARLPPTIACRQM